MGLYFAGATVVAVITMLEVRDGRTAAVRAIQTGVGMTIVLALLLKGFGFSF